MSISEEIRQLRRDLLALELRCISARLEAIERPKSAPADEANLQASEQHHRLTDAINRLADRNLTELWERLGRIEAQERNHQSSTAA